MKKRILIIDDDQVILKITERYLKGSGYDTCAIEDSTLAMEKMETFKPDVVLTDLMMPEVNGLQLVKQITERKELGNVKIIVVSAKFYEFDKNQALEMGAHAFLGKPVSRESLLETIDRVCKDEMIVKFWGTRGTIPKPGTQTLKYGGNTPCVSVELTKDRFFIFDAGTGISELGKFMISRQKRYKINLFITHPHWDHIHGFPFFMPVYRQGNEMVVYGTAHGNLSLREVVSGQMQSIHFPVTIKEFASRVYFKEISEGDHEVEGLSIKAILLNHPGIAMGYRLTSPSGKSLAYITDNELVPENSKRQDTYNRERLIKFLENVDVLIHDSSYFDHEYEKRVGWGHPPLSELLKLATEAKAKSVYLYHHDPDHFDDKVAEKEEFGKSYFKKRNLDIQCFAAIEGNEIKL